MTAPIHPQSAVIPAKAGIQSRIAPVFGPLWTPDHVRGDDADNGYADTAPPQDEICEGGENMDT